MTETSIANNRNTNSQITSGELLKTKREELGVSAAEVAKRLHLDIKIIEAIEANDYSNMPTATYVRGYLRSYAKTINADAEEVIALYNDDSPAPPPDILPEVKPPTQVSSSDKPVKAVTYLVSLGLVLLLLIWYQSNFIVENNDSQNTTESTPGRINNTDTNFKVVIHPEGWQTPVYDATEYIPNTDRPLSVDENISIENEKTEETTEDTNLGILPINDMEEVNSPVSSGPDSIVLKISKDSWIEIYDSNDKRLFMNLGRPGETHNINGKAPFNIILGFSEGVTVTFNGKPFDTTPYSHNGVARFTLPPQ